MLCVNLNEVSTLKTQDCYKTATELMVLIPGSREGSTDIKKKIFFCHCFVSLISWARTLTSFALCFFVFKMRAIINPLSKNRYCGDLR